MHVYEPPNSLVAIVDQVDLVPLDRRERLSALADRACGVASIR